MLNLKTKSNYMLVMAFLTATTICWDSNAAIPRLRSGGTRVSHWRDAGPLDLTNAKAATAKFLRAKWQDLRMGERILDFSGPEAREVAQEFFKSANLQDRFLGGLSTSNMRSFFPEGKVKRLVMNARSQVAIVVSEGKDASQLRITLLPIEGAIPSEMGGNIPKWVVEDHRTGAVGARKFIQNFFKENPQYSDILGEVQYSRTNAATLTREGADYTTYVRIPFFEIKIEEGKQSRIDESIDKMLERYKKINEGFEDSLMTKEASERGDVSREKLSGEYYTVAEAAEKAGASAWELEQILYEYQHEINFSYFPELHAVEIEHLRKTLAGDILIKADVKIEQARITLREAFEKEESKQLAEIQNRVLTSPEAIAKKADEIRLALTKSRDAEIAEKSMRVTENAEYDAKQKEDAIQNISQSITRQYQYKIERAIKEMQDSVLDQNGVAREIVRIKRVLQRRQFQRDQDLQLEILRELRLSN